VETVVSALTIAETMTPLQNTFKSNQINFINIQQQIKSKQVKRNKMNNIKILKLGQVGHK